MLVSSEQGVHGGTDPRAKLLRAFLVFLEVLGRPRTELAGYLPALLKYLAHHKVALLVPAKVLAMQLVVLKVRLV